jgi:mannosyltransferase
MNQNSAPPSATIRTGSNRGVVGGNDWLPLFGLMGVAAVIRLLGLSAANLWLDEANSWQVAIGSWSHLMGELRGSPVGPLYFILLKLWISALGDSAFALRAFSVVASIALIAVTYAVGAKLLSRPAALLGAALVAISPLELYFAQEARMYMLTSLVAMLTLWAYASWRSAAINELLADSTSPVGARSSTAPLLWYTLAAITLLFTHPVAGTLLVAINLDALVIWWRTRERAGTALHSPVRRRAIVLWIAAQVIVGAAVILYLAYLHLDSATSSQAWRSGLRFEVALRAAMLLPFNAIAGQKFKSSDFWFALYDFMNARGSFARFLVLLIVQPLTLFVLVLAGDAAVRERWGADRKSLTLPVVGSGRRLLLLSVIVPLLFAVTISLSRALETERYFLFVVPCFFLLLASGLVALQPSLRNFSLAVLGAAALFGTRATKAAITRDSDYRLTAALIERESHPGDRVMIQPREMNAPLRFYLRSFQIPIVGLAADAAAGHEIAASPPGRTWLVIDYRSPLYGLAPQELAAALHAPLERDAYTSDASTGVRVALVDTRSAKQ